MRLSFRIVLAVLASAAILVSSCKKDDPVVPPVTPTEKAVSDAQQTTILASVDSIMAAEKLPGVVMGVWRGSTEPFLLARGKADLATGRDITVNDRFRIASNTKMFTAQVILELADEQKLNLGETINGYFLNIPNAHSITIRHLLQMTAGLGDYAFDPAFVPSYINNPTKVWSRSTMYNLICGIAPVFQPGDSCLYLNTNYYLLGMIIEQVTGHTVEQEIHDRIIVPWGLTNTEFPVNEQMSGTHSKGYRDYQGTVNSEVTAVHPSGPWTGGAIISTIGDMKTFLRNIIDGKDLSPAMKQEHFTWRYMAPHVWYGLGVMKWGGLIGHNGSILGFNSMVVYLPAQDLFYVAYVNKCTENDGKFLCDDISKIVFGVLFGPAYPFE